MNDCFEKLELLKGVNLDDHSTSSSSLTGASLSSLVDLRLIEGAAQLDDSKFRAVHQISLRALEHNYYIVESAACNQRCDVICVLKADAYGHGAIDTATHLVDKVGANAFAVATLKEAIELRKALDSSSNNERLYRKFHGSEPLEQLSTRRDSFIRILVLGPPVGFPRCFNDYYHYQIECTISGPEVADALKQWVSNPFDIKRHLVERVSQATKQEFSTNLTGNPEREKQVDEGSTEISTVVTNSSALTDFSQTSVSKHLSSIGMKSATLNSTSGENLAKEFRQFLQTEQKVAAAAQEATGLSKTSTHSAKEEKETATTQKFQGIEAAARASVQRQAEEGQPAFVDKSLDKDDSESISSTSSFLMFTAGSSKQRLRWHAMVDSGMARDGFKTECFLDGEGIQRDTVEIIQELVNLQTYGAAPIEFFGMCTHMADANLTSTYTSSQIHRFKSLLKRVRNAGISVPTISTDNSSALLTPNLTHFDSFDLLEQNFGLNSHGFVRCGGALYGQRSSFTQLQTVSTLIATVRHVAVVKRGHSVGYDRAYIAPHDIRIATLAIGFGDGYPRELGNGKGHVYIRDSLYKVVGNVCMDMLMVELGRASEFSEVRVGDTATLWGGSGVPLATVASTLGTTQSALTCAIDKSRVLREYVV
eukprot:CAMPEP_0178910044 /NCGR_PEP_ID=MMETSP0786-20121207/8878_1 /TAXON_ID=186022 /ORGANISM="Thalassionema frauenfeldii, Strain CCMP 1798" /LENGTH=649 /DNA_ID=CAMNT_0020582251 /DNA_START=244 /DNA_END=2193 /DNA_ORIENTATION=+